MKPKTGPLFTFRLIPLIGAMLARRGIDVAQLLEESALPASAARGEITAPLARIQQFIGLVAKRLESPQFGLDLAAALPGGSYGVAEFVVRTAPTVEAGLRVLCEFAALINPSGLFRYVEGDEGSLHYSLGTQRDTLGTHLNEFTLAYMVRQIESVLPEGRMALSSVWFSHSRSSGAEAVAQHFGCPVRFQARDCGLAVPRDVLVLSPRTADALLFGFLSEQARGQLARLGSVDIVSQLVRVIEVRLASGELEVDDVASALAMTRRSLQRHLADAGTTYRDVLTHVRQRRRAELRGGNVGEAEIARQLGFSDQRSMRRSLDE